MRTLIIFTTILFLINFSTSQIPIINLAANATASIAANSSQNLSTGTNKDLIGKVILDAAQNQSASNQSAAAATESGSSDTSSNNSKVTLLPARNANDKDDQTEDFSNETNNYRNEEIEREKEAQADTESDLTIDEVLLPDIQGTEDSDEDIGTQESEDKEVKVQTPKPRRKHSRKSKTGRRIEKLVCHAEIEIDPEEPIFAENFEKYFE